MHGIYIADSYNEQLKLNCTQYVFPRDYCEIGCFVSNMTVGECEGSPSLR
jgi:hypothetical protein